MQMIVLTLGLVSFTCRCSRSYKPSSGWKTMSMLMTNFVLRHVIMISLLTLTDTTSFHSPVSTKNWGETCENNQSCVGQSGAKNGIYNYLCKSKADVRQQGRIDRLRKESPFGHIFFFHTSILRPIGIVAMKNSANISFDIIKSVCLRRRYTQCTIAQRLYWHHTKRIHKNDNKSEKFYTTSEYAPKYDFFLLHRGSKRCGTTISLRLSQGTSHVDWPPLRQDFDPKISCLLEYTIVQLTCNEWYWYWTEWWMTRRQMSKINLTYLYSSCTCVPSAIYALANALALRTLPIYAAEAWRLRFELFHYVPTSSMFLFPLTYVPIPSHYVPITYSLALVYFYSTAPLVRHHAQDQGAEPHWRLCSLRPSHITVRVARLEAFDGDSRHYSTGACHDQVIQNGQIRWW